ncbi:MAG: dihydropyrimidinase [Lachnospiraceae bacterium]|nr:dihydropyrimidinase [Lachnospiraceae bacterium]MDD3615687.1 dihydropyrimidinase [Lachnospiraceae bacterium]
MKYIIKNGTIVSGKETKTADILLEDGMIEKVEENLTNTPIAIDAKIIDASGKYVFPGFIDAHTHFDLEVSGTVTADDFETGTKAAIVGGTTLVIDFATQNKGETLKEASSNWHKKAEGRCSCDYAFHMAISDWNQEARRQIADMMEEGITTFKLYMTYPAMILNDGEIYEVLKELKKYGTFAGVHCENAPLIDAFIAEKKAKGHLGPDSHPLCRPPQVEAEAIHRLLVIAKEADNPVMVVHTTSKAAMEEIEIARAKGQKVYAETCPQYLLLDDSYFSLPDFKGANYVCSPPMRKSADQDYLWEALKLDEIQTISTDHCSFTTEQKKMGIHDFTKIPNGMPGVETRGELMYTYGVGQGKITLEQMCRLLSETPARLYGCYPQKGCIAPGSDGDITIIDPHKTKTIRAEKQMQNVDYAPFEGFEIKGCVDSVFLGGKLVVEDGKLVKANQGRFISRRQPELL